LPILISDWGFGGSFKTAAMIRFASGEDSGDFGEFDIVRPQKKKPWPPYNRGSPESLHAIAVLILNYNAFETALFRLFSHHLVNDNPTYKLAKKMYFSLPERNRLDLIKIVFGVCEKDPTVKVAISKLLRYFEWSAHTRNYFAHARHEPSFFQRDENNKIYLARRGQRYGPKAHYMKPSIPKIQNAADKIHQGMDYCFSICLYLEVRDVPSNELPLAARALWSLSSQSLPEIPPPPRKLSKSLTPHTPPMPAYLLQRPSGSKPKQS
jgi:hypothetical protein